MKMPSRQQIAKFYILSVFVLIIFFICYEILSLLIGELGWLRSIGFVVFFSLLIWALMEI